MHSLNMSNDAKASLMSMLKAYSASLRELAGFLAVYEIFIGAFLASK